MPELRPDPRTGSWTIVAPDRAGRSPGACPFCEGREHRTPPEVWRAPAEGGGWLVRVVPDKHPLLCPGVVPNPGRPATPTGHHEIVVESPKHDWDPADGDDTHVAAVLRAYQVRSLALRGRLGPGTGIVVAYRNHHGDTAAAGHHPHSHVAALPYLPPPASRGRTAVLPGLSGGPRTVARTASMIATVPYAPSADYETWIRPMRPHPDFAGAPREVVAETATLLRRVLSGMRRVLRGGPYSYVLAGPPYGTEPAAGSSWYLRVLPAPPVDGFRLGTGIAVVELTPEDAATRLRAALPRA